MSSESAVLVLTDSTALRRLDAEEPNWKPMAIDYEAAKEIDQLCFYCKDCEMVSHVAILDPKEPWVPVSVLGKPVTFLPNIVEVLELFDSLEMPYSEIQGLDDLDLCPDHNIEGVILGDVDDAFSSVDALKGYIGDGFITNRRNINTVGALRYLQHEGLDLAALAEEFTEVSAGLHSEQLDELPTNWKKGWDRTEDDQRALLSLLNSAFDSYMPAE